MLDKTFSFLLMSFCRFCFYIYLNSIYELDRGQNNMETLMTDDRESVGPSRLYRVLMSFLQAIIKESRGKHIPSSAGD